MITISAPSPNIQVNLCSQTSVVFEVVNYVPDSNSWTAVFTGNLPVSNPEGPTIVDNSGEITFQYIGDFPLFSIRIYGLYFEDILTLILPVTMFLGTFSVAPP